MAVKAKRKKNGITKARFVRAANYTKKLYVSDPSWNDKLIDAICWLITARTEYLAAERGLGVKDLIPFSPGWALRLPEGGSLIVTMPCAWLGERVSALPERAKPVEMEVFAVDTYAASLTAGFLIGPYEKGEIASCWLYAVNVERGMWMQADIATLLRSLAEEAVRLGGPRKAIEKECGGEKDLDTYRLLKKAVGLYRKGVV